MFIFYVALLFLSPISILNYAVPCGMAVYFTNLLLIACFSGGDFLFI
jgi:hypothetical protein